MIPTTSMHPRDGPAYSTAQIATAVPAGTFLSAIMHVNAGKSWTKAYYRAIQVGSMLTFE